MYNNYTDYDGMEAFIKAEKPDFIMPGLLWHCVPMAGKREFCRLAADQSASP